MKTGIWIAALVALVPLARAQEPQRTGLSPAEAHSEMNRLIVKVERTLSQIDHLLGDAAQARAANPADVAQRLKDSLERGRSVERDITRILELANHEHPPGGS